MLFDMPLPHAVLVHAAYRRRAMPRLVDRMAQIMMLKSNITNGSLRLFGRPVGEECITNYSDVEWFELFAPFVACTTG
jgi:hypothetical protein